MTIDEAIALLNEKLCCDYNISGCSSCDISSCEEKDLCNQLAEWLEELKRLRELFANNLKKDCNTCEQTIYEKAYKKGQDKGFSDGHFFGYNKAIDDYMNKLFNHCMQQTNECYRLECPFFTDGCDVVNIAEKLNKGKINE